MNWELLLKYVNGESNHDETREVEKWADEQEEHKHLLGYLQKRKVQLEQPLRQDDIHEQWVLLLDRIFETPAKTNKSGLNGRWLLGMAASLLLVSLAGWYYLGIDKPEPDAKVVTLQTPADRRGHVTLPDSSEVYMAPGSTVTYNATFGQAKREIHLSGEAFFNVRHQVHRPFVVYTPNSLSVTVLGTSFNIYARKNLNTEVKVATGLVGITTGKSTHFLSAGQQLDYQTNQQLVMKPVALNDAAALQNQTLYFKNNNADEIAQKLHRWYNLNFEVMPSARKHPSFSGEMKDAGINNLMKGLSYATGLNYRYTDTHTILLF